MWLKSTCLRLVYVGLFCFLLYNKQGKAFKVRRKNSNRLNGKRQFIINWWWLWVQIVQLPNRAFPPETQGRASLRYFSPWDSAWCRMILQLFTQTSLSNHAGGQGRMCYQSLAAGGVFLWQFTMQGKPLFPQWSSFTFRNTQKMNFWAGGWIQICILSTRLKLPSSVILVWSIPGTRCSSFLQMQTWIWKPSFPLPTPSGRWDFPSFVKIVTYKRRKGLRAVHHVYFTWYVFALALAQAVFMPNDSSICSPTPIFCVAYVEHLVLKVSQFLNIF